MKRTLAAILLIAALTAPAFGQFVPGSMQNGMTMGLFETEIDQSFKPNPDFGDYESSFLFTGLGNPLAGVIDSSTLLYFNDHDAFDITFTAPLRLGYYMAGSLPISLYSSMDFAGLSTRDIISDYTTTTTATANVVAGTTTTVHRWIDMSATVSPTDTILFRDYAFDIQALTKVGPATVGLYLNLEGDNSLSDFAAANDYFASSVVTYNYNSAAVGVVPIASLDYTVTASTTNVDPAALPAAGGVGEYAFADTIRVGVPFAMRTGTLEHVAYIDATFGSIDSSAAYSYAETLHADSAGGAAVDDTTLALTSKTSSTDVSLDYRFTMPAGNDGDEWLARAGFGLAIDGKEYSYDELVRPYDLSVVAAKTALTGGTHTASTEEYQSALGVSATIGGGRVFAFEPASAIAFKVAPQGSISVETEVNGGAAWLVGSTSYVKTLDATGALDAATAYDHVTIAVTGDPSKQLTLLAEASLPMGLVMIPQGWKFGFMMGAAPSVALSTIFSTTATLDTKTTTVNYSGTTVNTTTITTTAPSPAQTTSSFVFAFSENHYVGITVPFEGGVRFDARLNGNLLNFESFTIQALIPLN